MLLGREKIFKSAYGFEISALLQLDLLKFKSLAKNHTCAKTLCGMKSGKLILLKTYLNL